MDGSPVPGPLGSSGLPWPSIPEYELRRCLGRGGGGDVWLSRHHAGQWCSIKVVRRSHLRSQPAFEEAFRVLRGYAPVSRVHGSLAAIAQTGHEGHGQDQYFYAVMELADPMPSEAEGVRGLFEPETIHGGGSPSGTDAPRRLDPASYRPKTLRHWLDRSTEAGPARLTLSECVRLGLALAGALEALHQRGLVHGRIHPSNILWVNGQPKLSEIALCPPEARVPRSDARMDTYYDSPEGPGTIQADLYSLGRVLQEARDGRRSPPWAGPEAMRDGAVETAGVEAQWTETVRLLCGRGLDAPCLSAAQLRVRLAGLLAELSAGHARTQAGI